MKQLLSILLLSVITVTAYADKNAKPNKVQQPQPKPRQAVTPASDTAWHGTGNHYDYGQREYDTRVGRSMPVDPSTRPSPFGNNPYQNTTNNPVKLDK